MKIHLILLFICCFSFLHSSDEAAVSLARLMCALEKGPICFTDTEIDDLYIEIADLVDPDDVDFLLETKALDVTQTQDRLFQLWKKSIQEPLDIKRDVNCKVKDHFFSQFQYSNFDDNPYFSLKEIMMTRPYLMPLDHHLKPIFDKLTSSFRIVQDKSLYLAAGFQLMELRPGSRPRVSRHPLMPGYVIKVYFDTSTDVKDNTPDWLWFVYRCMGAKNVQAVIEKYNLKHFVVPNKCLYPLPKDPSPPSSPLYARKHTLLIADDMPLLDMNENLRLWKEAVTKEQLKELFTILTNAASIRSRPDNINFMADGRLALIDTEYPHKRPDLGSIRPFLSQKMVQYWDDLVRNR